MLPTQPTQATALTDYVMVSYGAFHLAANRVDGARPYWQVVADDGRPLFNIWAYLSHGFKRVLAQLHLHQLTQDYLTVEGWVDRFVSTIEKIETDRQFAIVH